MSQPPSLKGTVSDVHLTVVGILYTNNVDGANGMCRRIPAFIQYLLRDFVRGHNPNFLSKIRLCPNSILRFRGYVLRNAAFRNRNYSALFPDSQDVPLLRIRGRLIGDQGLFKPFTMSREGGDVGLICRL